MNPTTVLCLSGGLDSVIELYHLVHHEVRTHAVLFDYGQKHVQELIWARHHCGVLKVPFTTITLTQLRGSLLTDGTGSVIVPGRNSILLAHAANLACHLGAISVTLAVNQDDHRVFLDTRPHFIESYNAMLKAAGLGIAVVTPFGRLTKTQVARLGQDLKVPLYQTWSCYEGGAFPCGLCLACTTRDQALSQCAL